MKWFERQTLFKSFPITSSTVLQSGIQRNYNSIEAALYLNHTLTEYWMAHFFRALYAKRTEKSKQRNFRNWGTSADWDSLSFYPRSLWRRLVRKELWLISSLCHEGVRVKWSCNANILRWCCSINPSELQTIRIHAAVLQFWKRKVYGWLEYVLKMTTPSPPRLFCLKS